jgi:hypothetical protein
VLLRTLCWLAAAWAFPRSTALIPNHPGLLNAWFPSAGWVEAFPARVQRILFPPIQPVAILLGVMGATVRVQPHVLISGVTLSSVT